MLSVVDTKNLRHLPRRSSKNCDLQFANTDRQLDFKENYSIDNNEVVFIPAVKSKNRRNVFGGSGLGLVLLLVLGLVLG